MSENQDPAFTVLALADQAVIQCLRKVGKRMLKSPRSRFKEFQANGTLALHEVHTLWQPDVFVASQIVEGEWEALMIALRGNSPQANARAVMEMVERYTLNLMLRGEPHTRDALQRELRV